MPPPPLAPPLATTASIALGLVAAALVARLQRARDPLDSETRFRVVVAAAVGAIVGAYALQWPADHFGWSWLPGDAIAAIAARDARPLGGRTVLGGLIGGWLAVELAKKRWRIATPTGDAFAAPLAAALACGRIGCSLAGCCVGRACVDSWWSLHDAAGTPRLPIAPLEAAFHALACIALLAADRRDAARGRRLALYLAAVAALRFALELARENAPLALGLTWYQWLALALFALAGGTWWTRSRSARRAGVAGNTAAPRSAP